MLLNCGVKSRWSATLFVYLGFNVSQAVPTRHNGYWNNSLIKIIHPPISRRKRDYSLCVWHGQGQCQPCLHCSAPALPFLVLPSRLLPPRDSVVPALRRTGMQRGLAETRTTPSTPLGRLGFWPVVTKMGSTVSWKSSSLYSGAR